MVRGGDRGYFKVRIFLVVTWEDKLLFIGILEVWRLYCFKRCVVLGMLFFFVMF